MISKIKISKKILNKRNPEIIETIKIAKNNKLLELAKKISGSSRLYRNVNLNQLESIKNNKIMVIGSVLGSGDVNRKFEVSALKFSKQAIEKLNKSGCKISKIKEEIIKNKNLDGVEIIW